MRVFQGRQQQVAVEIDAAAVRDPLAQLGRPGVVSAFAVRLGQRRGTLEADGVGVAIVGVAEVRLAGQRIAHHVLDLGAGHHVLVFGGSQAVAVLGW